MSRSYIIWTPKRRLMIARSLLHEFRDLWVVFDLDSPDEGLPALTGGFRLLRDAKAAAEEIKRADRGDAS